ncbi:MAG: CapA family protein [Candidatus Limiplasma sp.]|nr:CapA family protein [Candidatus Limiplasma sp.]
MAKRWISLLLTAALCLAGTALSLAEEEDVSLAEYFAQQAGEKVEARESAGAEAAAASAEQPAYGPDGSAVITMSFTGDVTIGSNAQSRRTSIFEKELEKQKGDLHFPFRNVKGVFDADDLTVVNFEGTLTTADKHPDKLDNDFLFRAPPEYALMLPQGGVEAVSFENNHAMDMGGEGNQETKQALLSQGVAYASEGEPAVLEVKGVKIGLLAYQTFGGRHDELMEKVPQEIAALRREGCAIVVVNYHWGQEKDYAPNDNQIRLGRATVDGGADLVIGHHSHRINPIEFYNGKYICYSLGNFSFAGHNKPDDMSTYIFQVKMRVKDGGVTSDGFIIIPCRISSRADYNDFAPTPYTEDRDIQGVLGKLKKNGAKLRYAVEEYPLQWLGED